MIQGLGLLQCERPGVVTVAELNECGWGNGAFEMKMEFGLGQAADKPLDFGHGSSLAEEAVALIARRSGCASRQGDAGGLPGGCSGHRRFRWRRAPGALVR